MLLHVNVHPFNFKALGFKESLSFQRYIASTFMRTMVQNATLGFLMIAMSRDIIVGIPEYTLIWCSLIHI